MQDLDSRIRVVHRHRIGHQLPFTRVSELVYRGEEPLAVLSWVHESGARIPAVCIALDPRLLHRGSNRKFFVYEGLTRDPRFEPL